MFDELVSQHRRRRHVVPGAWRSNTAHSRIGVPSIGPRQFDPTTSDGVECSRPPDGSRTVGI